MENDFSCICVKQSSERTERAVLKKNTSNGCWFWGPLEMVGMEPLSVLNNTVKQFSFWLSDFYFFNPVGLIVISKENEHGPKK